MCNINITDIYIVTDIYFVGDFFFKLLKFSNLFHTSNSSKHPMCVNTIHEKILRRIKIAIL